MPSRIYDDAQDDAESELMKHLLRKELRKLGLDDDIEVLGKITIEHGKVNYDIEKLKNLAVKMTMDAIKNNKIYEAFDKFQYEGNIDETNREAAKRLLPALNLTQEDFVAIHNIAHMLMDRAKEHNMDACTAATEMMFFGIFLARYKT